MIRIEITTETGADAIKEMREMLQAMTTGAPAAVIQPGMPKIETDPALLKRLEDAAQASKTAPSAAVEDEKPKRTRGGKKKDEQPAPEPAKEPELPLEDSADDQAQDAADEAADEEDGDDFTVDDLRKIWGRYAQRYGMPAAQKDGIEINRRHGYTNIASFADADQETLKKALADAHDAFDKNTFNREVVGDVQ